MTWDRANRLLWYVVCGPFVLLYLAFLAVGAILLLPFTALAYWVVKYQPEKTRTYDDYYRGDLK